MVICILELGNRCRILFYYCQVIPQMWLFYKYQDLANEIAAMLNVNSVEIIPIVISTNGVINPSFYFHAKKINLPLYLIHEMQKSVLLENCRLVRKFLSHQ